MPLCGRLHETHFQKHKCLSMDEFGENCEYPREMLDENLATDDVKPSYVSHISGGKKLLAGLNKKSSVVISGLAKRFGIMSQLLCS